MCQRPIDERSSNKLLLVCLSVVVLANVFVSRIQSSFGDVQVRDIKIPAHNGQWVVGDLFKPKSATSEQPAPLIVVVPGFQRSKESLSNIAIELARRGFVALSIDPYAQGGSSASLSRMAATTEGYGMFAPLVPATSTTSTKKPNWSNRTFCRRQCRNSWCQLFRQGGATNRATQQTPFGLRLWFRSHADR